MNYLLISFFALCELGFACLAVYYFRKWAEEKELKGGRKYDFFEVQDCN